MYQKIIYYKNRLIEQGFLSIITSAFLVKLITFCSSMLLPRFLKMEDYGTLVYCESIVMYFMFVNGAGLANATFKFVALDNFNISKKEIIRLTTLVGLVFNVIGIFAITLYINIFCKVDSNEKTIIFLLLLFSFLSFIIQNAQMYFRATFENKIYTKVATYHAFFFVIIQLIFARYYGVIGVLVARFMVGTCTAIWCVSKIGLSNEKHLGNLSWHYIKVFLTYSINIVAANFLSMSLFNNDIFLIGYIFANKQLVATYKVASYVIPICIFFIDAIMTFALPFFIRRKQDGNWIWKRFKYISLINLIIVSVLFFLLYTKAEVFIRIFFSSKYLGAIPMLKKLLIAAFVQNVLRAVPGNILAVIGEESYNLKINILSFFIHSMLDYFLLTRYGTKYIGVSLAFTYGLTGILMILRLRRVCSVCGKQNNKILSKI